MPILITDPADTDVLLSARDLLRSKDGKGTKSTFVTTDQETAHIIDAEGTRISPLIQGTFPTYEAIYPTAEPVLEIAFSVDVLQTVLKVAGKDNYVKFTFYNKSSAVKFVVPNVDIQGLAMPFMAKD